MRAKETLQLRHQLACNGLSLRAATYDTKRHHVLTFDSHPLRPHVLRLFSLRRELKSVPLFDRKDDERVKRNHTEDCTKTPPGQVGHKKFSFFEMQQQQQQQEKLAQRREVDVMVPSVFLAYSPTLDVFVCVYTSASKAKPSKQRLVTTHSVLLLEPGTLRKLILYPGPATHSLQCTHYDPWTDRLVLASHLMNGKHEESNMLPRAPMNVVEILQLSKRFDDRDAGWPSSDLQDQHEKPRMLLYVENTRASLRHPDVLEIICGSRGLRALYGAAGGATSKQAVRRSSGSIDTSRSESAFLEWRASQAHVGKFTLVRRVMFRQAITAMAISPCGDWLLAGFYKGGLKVWNANGSRTNGSTLFTVGAAPYEPMGVGIEDAQTETISSIEITITPTAETNGNPMAASRTTDLIVIAAAEDTGIVRHWKLSIERRVFGSGNEGVGSGEHRHPRLDLVGYFNSGGKDKDGQEDGKRGDKDALGPPLKTLLMCVNIDMGSCFENLLLVVHEDVIHILKVQTVLYVIQDFASVETAYVVRAVTTQDERRVISLSGTPSSKLRTFPLDENIIASDQAPPSAQSMFISPPSSVSAHISLIETVMKDKVQTSFIALAWSNGVVDIYDVSQEKRVRTLRDNQLTDQITALSVITFRRASRINGKSAAQHTDEMDYLSYGGAFGNPINDLTDRRDTNIPIDGILHARKTVVVVGTENGKLLGWNVEGFWDEPLEFQSIPAAKVRVKAAHSVHVVQLAPIDTSGVEEQAVLTSVGADGIIKLWKIPSLVMVGYVSSVVVGYAVAPSCIGPVGIPETGNVETGIRTSGEFYVSVGYEDGRLSVWRVDLKHASFQHLNVSTKHERRVSKICSVSNDVGENGSIEFMSCSLDMTVIHWQILGSGTVQEKRYFDIGAAIVDMMLIEEQAVIALAHEVCKFVFASKPSMKHQVSHEAAKVGANAVLDNSQNGNDDQHVHTNQFSDAEKYPDTPTTRSIENANEVTSPTRQASRSVDEYLTLHVPTAVLLPDAASEVPINKLSPPKLSNEEAALVNPSNGGTDTLSQNSRRSKNTDKLRRPSVDDEMLHEYVQDYIARHGTSGTMAAGRLVDFLALRPELPAIKRPGFALAKTLKEWKLNALDRVDSGEALQVLKVLFETANAPIMARALKGQLSKRARAQKMHEKDQAKRKSVVTYNILGEKYVQWEEVQEVQSGGLVQNQSPSSPTNSVAVHTPPSPSLRESPETGWPSTDPPQETAALEGLSKFGSATTSLVVEAPPTNGDDSCGGQTGFNNESDAPLSEETERVVVTVGDHPAAIKVTEFNNTESITTQPTENEEARHGILEGEQHPGKRIEEYGISGVTREIHLESALLSSIRLSSKFQKFWTKGFCWCQPTPRLHVIWTGLDSVKTSNGDKSTKSQQRKCNGCRNQLHTVKMTRAGYIPHFSRQAIFGIILEVYSKLTSTAHTLLYKSSSAKQNSSEFSIFGALYKVFLATYGMQSTAELKLKLFFASMCHFLRNYDAIAVFGELIGLHTPEDADEYDQAPSTLVALCVCCYSWLYSRGMVTNGDCFTGCGPGNERWRRANTTVAEVTPAKDGTTHWQYVRIEHVLLCAQDNLLYPLVSPSFLRNIMFFMQEYAQQTPDRPHNVDTHEIGDEYAANHYQGGLKNPVEWVEIHRFLRFLVGEWKQQNAQFRVAERLLFVHPSRNAKFEGEILEKLRLMLNCFVFYDHERAGAIHIRDFESLLLKLQYLWSEKSAIAPTFPLTSEDPIFDDALLAIRKRFTDVNHDGELCYLDFWAMLYIVSVKTCSLIQLHEIPSFCRDYRLEVLPQLTDTLWSYMQLSCIILLPKGLHLGKSSLDQKAGHQHRRRVGGLHDGMFHIGKTLETSLSTQELLSSDNTSRRGLFLDGTVPAIRQSASAAALDRFRPVSVEAEFNTSNEDASLRHHGREPVVVGIRPIGPTPKRIAPLRVSSLGYNEENSDLNHLVEPRNFVGAQEIRASNLKQIPEGDYTNMYIQFPQVPPVRKHIGRGVPSEEILYPTRQIVGNIPLGEDDDGNDEWESSITSESGQEDRREEVLQVEIPPTVQEISSRVSSAKSVASIQDSTTTREQTVQETVVSVDEPRPLSRKASFKRRRSTATVVVVPTVETEAPIPRKSSRSERLKRQRSRGVQRVKSTLVKLEESVSLVNTDEIVPPSPVAPVTTTHEETPPDSGSEEYQDVGSHVGNLEVGIDAKEEPHKQDTEVLQMVTGSVASVVAEDPPEPEPTINVPVEIVDSIVESVDPTTLRIEEKENVIESEATPDPPELDPVIAEVTEPAPVVAEMTEPVLVVTEMTEFVSIDDEIMESVSYEEVSPTPMLIDESIPAREALAVESDGEVEVVTERIDESQYTPQTIKEEEIQIHRAFRFSQQPAFIRSVEVTNNPYRTAMWNPNDDSDNENDENDTTSDVDDKDDRDMDISLQPYDEEQLGGSVSDGIKLSTIHPSGTRKPLTDQLGNLDNNALSLRQHTENINVQGTTISIPLKPNGCVRLDEDAERALYGERVLNVLGDGIAFSPEAEAAMQHKWQQFFDESESIMFSTLRNELEQRQTEQREAEERQRKLRKKWQEQRDQDLLRLQQSRQNNMLMSASMDATGDGTVDANFRQRRIDRESCREVTEELQFGVSIQRECKAEKEARFFHFYYLPDSNGSIITLKMHATRGDAEVFMSTETKVPCGTDFMWKSSEKLAKTQGEPDEGHRIILYPHDLLRVTAAAANTAPTEQPAAIVDTNSRTTSFTALRIGFYLSVVTLEPDTIFTLAIMSSGQRMQPSKAMQTVDYLIDRFDMLSRSFEQNSSAPFINPPRNLRRGAAKLSSTAENDFENPQWASFDDSDNDTVDETYEGNEDADSEEQSTARVSGRRKAKKQMGENVDLNELKPFQQLLETLSEKKGYAPPRINSILLAGPNEENLDFVQDEGYRLQELHQRFSPTKDAGGVHANQPDIESVMTEQRLTLQGKRQKLRRVVASRLKQRLEPLRQKAVAVDALGKSVSTGSLATICLAKSAPRPVAYSITTLDQLPRGHLTKSATVSLLRARQAEKQLTCGTEAKELTNGVESLQKD